MVGAALSGYLGWKFGYPAVFVLAALFGMIAIVCVGMIPSETIDHRAARGVREDDADSQPSSFKVLLTHKPLLILAASLAAFHLGNAGLLPLYGLAVVSTSQTDGVSFVAMTVVTAQATMVIASIGAMRVAEVRGYWPVLFVSFAALPIRGVIAYYFHSWWGVFPIQLLDGVGAGLQAWPFPEWWRVRLMAPAGSTSVRALFLPCRGLGASLSPAIGGWIAQELGYGPMFLTLGGFGLVSVLFWIGFFKTVKRY